MLLLRRDIVAGALPITFEAAGGVLRCMCTYNFGIRLPDLICARLRRVYSRCGRQRCRLPGESALALGDRNFQALGEGYADD